MRDALMVFLTFLCLLMPIWYVVSVIGSFFLAAYMIARG
jgi:hypothetical protein